MQSILDSRSERLVLESNVDAGHYLAEEEDASSSILLIDKLKLLVIQD